MRVSLLRLLVLLSLVGPGAARADVIHLRSGRLEGKVVERKDGHVRIRTDAGIVATVREEEVVRIDRRETAADAYEAMASRVSSADADGHYALALWCRDHGLNDAMQEELAATVAADADHGGARAALGQVKVAGGWKPRDEAMRERGLVLADGEWVSKEEAAERARTAEFKRLVRYVDAVVYKIHVGPKEQRDAWEEKLAAVDRPIIAAKMAALLSDRHPAVRRAACRSLAAMKRRDAVPKLVRSFLFDSEEPVRAAALDAALGLDRDETAENLHRTVAGLKVQPIRDRRTQRAAKRLYRRLALGLDAVGELRSVPFLIEILYPNIELEALDAGGLGIIVSRGESRAEDPVVVGTGLAEGVPREPERYYFNQAAEDALKRLTGRDLGVLPKVWAQWWKEHGAERLRQAEARRRPGAKDAERLLDEAIHE